MTKSISLAVILALASTFAACGRDDRQEKAAAAAEKKGTFGTGSAASGMSTKGPLQTGESTPAATDLPDGTKSGGRTTPNPK